MSNLSFPDYPILPYLVDWIRLNFDTSSELLPSILDKLPSLSPSALASLWSLTISHVCHGATFAAARLLHHIKASVEQGEPSSTSSSTVRQLDSMAELLAKKPEFVPSPGASVSQFQSSFLAWQEEAKLRLENNVFASHPQLTFIAKVSFDCRIRHFNSPTL
jgi:hypothetical protein